MSNEFKSDLRTAADQFKAEATRTGNAAVAQREVTAKVYADQGVTEEMVKAVNNANSLIANAGILAAGEMASGHFNGEGAADDRFSLTVQGFGRDNFEAVIKKVGVVNIPGNKEKGIEAREENRPLQVASQRWTHHGNRGNGEYQSIKGHLNEMGKPLLAAIAKNQG